MNKPIDIAESIGLMLLADSYLNGANFTIVPDTLPTYEETLHHLTQRKDIFKLYKGEGFTIITCDKGWLYEKFSLVDDTINYKELDNTRIQSDIPKLNLLLRKFINGQAYNSYVDKTNNFMELKFGFNTITKHKQVKYHKTNLYAFSLALTDTLNTLNKAQKALGVQFYLRVKENDTIKYQDLLTCIKEDNTLTKALSGAEHHPSNTSVILTIRVLLTDLNLTRVSNGLIN